MWKKSRTTSSLYYLESRNQGISTFIENLKRHGVSEDIINLALNEITN